ncbi:MAG: M23 family metallopeptidase [Gemmatimonadaceae bacterium]
MSLRWVRAIAYGVVALLGVAAVLFTSPLPPRALRPAGEVLSEAHEEHRWNDRHDTVARGESLASVLARGGVSEVIAREALTTLKVLDPRRVRVGMPVTVRTAATDSVPTEIILRLAVDRILHLKRDSSGWKEIDERLPWRMDTIVVSGRIRTNLYEAVDAAARGALTGSAQNRLVLALAEDIFEYRVDMSRDLQVGDEFRVVAQRSVGPEGIMRIDTVLGASMTLSGKTIEAVRFKSQKVGGVYFDQNGKPMRSGFLRTPVRFSRISSKFGLRRHPILGTMRKHQGTDYAAAAGTPIRAIGDGVVIRAGWHNGYGNVVDIRHANGYVSRYGHMRGFAAGVRGGARVTREQVIGYVGSTGLSTAPHLHFEVHVKGTQRNPGAVLANVSADPIPTSERVAFADARTRTLALLQMPAVLATAESASVKQAGRQQQ